MKVLFAVLALAVVAMADPAEQQRARRGLLGAPLLAPAAIVTPALGGAVLGHGPALVAAPTVVAGAPWGKVAIAGAPWGKVAVAGPTIWG